MHSCMYCRQKALCVYARGVIFEKPMFLSKKQHYSIFPTVLLNSLQAQSVTVLKGTERTFFIPLLVIFLQ